MRERDVNGARWGSGECFYTAGKDERDTVSVR